jgi:hypothetical protein
MDIYKDHKIINKNYPDDNDKYIRIYSLDNNNNTISFLVNKDILLTSNLIRSLEFEYLDNNIIELNNFRTIRTDILYNILLYMKHIYDNNNYIIIQQPLNNDIELYIDNFEIAFLNNIENYELIYYLKISDYLEINKLTDLLSASFSNRIKKLNTNDINNQFGIENNYTREEIQNIYNIDYFD